MLSWLDTAMQQERYRDLLREAQTEQLVKQAQQSCKPGHPFYHQAFTWLGKQLVTWGVSLQTQFGSAISDPTLELAHLNQS